MDIIILMVITLAFTLIVMALYGIGEADCTCGLDAMKGGE